MSIEDLNLSPPTVQEKVCYIKPMIINTRWNLHGFVPTPLLKKNKKGWRTQLRCLKAVSELPDSECEGITFYVAMHCHPKSLTAA